MERLYENMRRQLRNLNTDFKRYQYENINWNNQMLALVGPRGVGKTTLFLQKVRELNDSKTVLYFSADNLYFTQHTLLETADAFYKNGGKFLFIDEVHKYSGWSQELKNMYDAYPEMHVYFTGSSVLDIEKGNADLSRRAPTYKMQGLSFREFLRIYKNIDVKAFSLAEILAGEASINNLDHPLELFKEYLKRGYYPFGLDDDFDIELTQVITRTLEFDIPQYANMNMSTGHKLLKLMTVISGLVPFKPNASDLGRRVQVSRNVVEDYLLFMEKAGMIAQLRTAAGGLGALGKVEKVYLDNTNILSVLSNGQMDIGTTRETFFFNQMRVNNFVTSSNIADFEIEGIVFEVGGKNKGFDQVKGTSNGYIVRDDIEWGYGNVVPLWAFGLNY